MKAISLILCGLFACGFSTMLNAQTYDNQSLTEGQVVKVLVFSKNASKRSSYYIGSTLKIKTVQGQKIQGRINYLNDSLLILSGQRIPLKNIAFYYKPMNTCLILGSAAGAAGAGYIILDAANNAIADIKPTTTAQTWIVGGSLLAAAAALLPFKEVKRKTTVWRPQVLSMDPISY